MSAAELIKGFEGCRLTSYKDIKGVWTIGWGCTGPGIGPGLTWTQAQADGALNHRLAALQDVVLHLVTVSITPNELAALLSLAWNIGSHAFGISTVLRKLNANDKQAAADAFLLWDKVDGKDNQGLKNRRQVERALFLKDTSPGAPLTN